MSPLVLALLLVHGLDSLRALAEVAAAGHVDAHDVRLALRRAVRRRLASRTELASGALLFLVAVSCAVGGP